MSTKDIEPIPVAAIVPTRLAWPSEKLPPPDSRRLPAPIVPPDCVTALVSPIARMPEEDVMVAARLVPAMPLNVSVPLPLLVTVLPLDDRSIPRDPELVAPLMVRLPLDTVSAVDEGEESGDLAEQLALGILPQELEGRLRAVLANHRNAEMRYQHARAVGCLNLEVAVHMAH